MQCHAMQRTRFVAWMLFHVTRCRGRGSWHEPGFMSRATANEVRDIDRISCHAVISWDLKWRRFQWDLKWHRFGRNLKWPRGGTPVKPAQRQLFEIELLLMSVPPRAWCRSFAGTLYVWVSPLFGLTRIETHKWNWAELDLNDLLLFFCAGWRVVCLLWLDSCLFSVFSIFPIN